MKPFDQSYWDTHYQDIKTIDGIGNVKDHSRYLLAYFNIEGFTPESMVDLGFGTGHLMKEMARALKPRRIEGIEPSPPAFKRMKMPLAKLHHEDLVTWARNPARARWAFDLGLCTSVLQYLTDKELKEVLPIMAKRCRYLYLTVPTDIEYKRQQSELQFSDSWARVRTREQYQKLIRPHFTFISSRILESKVFYDDTTTEFQDLLFRY